MISSLEGISERPKSTIGIVQRQVRSLVNEFKGYGERSFGGSGEKFDCYLSVSS